jgi:hypothetical protein
LEQKFHEYFYCGDTELRLSHLTTIKQKYNEHVADYIRRFRDTRNQYFNLNISDKDLAVLAYSGLSPLLKEKLESHILSDISRKPTCAEPSGIGPPNPNHSYGLA